MLSKSAYVFLQLLYVTDDLKIYKIINTNDHCVSMRDLKRLDADKYYYIYAFL